MSKEANRIVDDAIRKANEQARRLDPATGYLMGTTSGVNGSGRAIDMDNRMNQQHWNQVLAGINISVANSLDIGRKALNAYIKEEAEPRAKDLDRIKETVDILDGTRNTNSLHKRAVRMEHLRSLAGMTSMPMNVKKAQAAPTKEEFNALVDAFRELWGMIFEIEIQRRTHGNSPK